MTSRTLRILVFSSWVMGCGTTALEVTSDASVDDADAGAGDSAVDADGGDGRADGSDEVATCGGPSERPYLTGCVVSSALVNLTPDGQGRPEWQLVMDGTVTELGSGEPPGGCRRQPSIGAGYPAPPDPASDGAWLRLVSDSGEQALVALAARGATWRVQTGERLAVDFRSVEGDFSPGATHLTVRDADGALRAWASSGGELDDLVLPAELRVEQGDLACTGGDPDGCIESYAFYALSVSADGEQKQLAYGAVERVGAYDVLHGGLEVQTGDSLCDDAYVAHAALAAFRP